MLIIIFDKKINYFNKKVRLFFKLLLEQFLPATEIKPIQIDKSLNSSLKFLNSSKGTLYGIDPRLSRRKLRVLSSPLSPQYIHY